MKRSALRRFLESIVVSSPLLIGACTGGASMPDLQSYPDAGFCPPRDIGIVEFRVDGSPPDAYDCQAACTAAARENLGYVDSCDYETDGGATTLVCRTRLLCLGGCRPAGLAAAIATSESDVVGAHFARMAHLEEASVTAFRRLARELRLHGAPPSLIAAAKRAARDEIRHTHTMSALARRHGVEPPRAQVDDVGPRSLEEIAVENAVEGCVLETHGAALATYAAQAAGDPLVRRAMAVIARDETRHAELAWDVAAWAARRLSPPSRARVAAARADAVEALYAAADAPVDDALIAIAGVPPPSENRALVAAARAALWAA